MIEVDQLVKTYGTVHAVQGLSLTVRDGEILGLVGPNGAGKTTTVRMLVGLIRPASGRGRLLGRGRATGRRRARRDERRQRRGTAAAEQRPSAQPDAVENEPSVTDDNWSAGPATRDSTIRRPSMRGRIRREQRVDDLSSH